MLVSPAIRWAKSLAHGASGTARVAALILVDAPGRRGTQLVPIGFLAARVPLLNRLFDWVLPRPVVVASLCTVSATRALAKSSSPGTCSCAARGQRHALVQRLQQSACGEDAARISTCACHLRPLAPSRQPDTDEAAQRFRPTSRAASLWCSTRSATCPTKKSRYARWVRFELPAAVIDLPSTMEKKRYKVVR